MRCKICDKKLSLSEVKRKDNYNTYTDTCGTCLGVTFKSLSEFEYKYHDGFSDFIFDKDEDF